MQGCAQEGTAEAVAAQSGAMPGTQAEVGDPLFVGIPPFPAAGVEVEAG
jgi:hypothetical protein